MCSRAFSVHPSDSHGLFLAAVTGKGRHHHQHIKKKKAIYLFMDVLGLHCCTQAFTSCGKQELLFSCSMWASHCSSSWLLGFSLRAQVLGYTGLGPPRHVGFAQTRDRSGIPHLARQTPHHWTTREAHHGLRCTVFYSLHRALSDPISFYLCHILDFISSL